MLVLGIETSCDETAAAVVGPGPDGGARSVVLSDVIYSQQVHVDYGGVVPELASRAHAEKVVVTSRAALERAGVDRPDAVAATAGPGLLGAVLVGLCYGKALAAGWGVPFIGVNHLEGHLLSPLLEDPGPSWPFLGLVVSGGHTTLYLAAGLGDYTVLGSTVDDAAGEAYDKVARMLGLGYPGGPIIDRLAAAGTQQLFSLPRPVVREPKTRQPTLSWSFSGLKTAVRTLLLEHPEASAQDVACAFQDTVAELLVDRILRAADQTGVRSVAISGGVAANSELRARLLGLQAQGRLSLSLPPRARCTDNGAMIAHIGRLRGLAGQRDPLSFPARAQWTPGT
ncbi:MAG: tRNA (adenosine(37)-N6)-threonylcarbamoyltransferase complex transferase subunit TsaD [Oligoflexia bacterium]|nr:tRNA (adenosine(37)-N6)-threonylcarbamoyltransferase complex transferase subunit TsaD [Oligoflexia bacterium]